MFLRRDLAALEADLQICELISLFIRCENKSDGEKKKKKNRDVRKCERTCLEDFIAHTWFRSNWVGSNRSWLYRSRTHWAKIYCLFKIFFFQQDLFSIQETNIFQKMQKTKKKSIFKLHIFQNQNYNHVEGKRMEKHPN